MFLFKKFLVLTLGAAAMTDALNLNWSFDRVIANGRCNDGLSYNRYFGNICANLQTLGDPEALQWCKRNGNHPQDDGSRPNDRCCKCIPLKRRTKPFGVPGRGVGSGGCFPPDTLVVLSTKAAVPISTLRLGDQLELGGTVQALMQLQGGGEPLFDVAGVRVTGSHAVRDPKDGVWRRVEHAGQPLNTTVPVVWNVITEHHRVVAVPRAGASRALELADFMEVDDSPEMLQSNLQELNHREL